MIGKRDGKRPPGGGALDYVDEGIILKWSLKLLLEKGWA